ncbi:MAG: response regulator [Flavobacteriales bacterium]|jgi:DNA-binding LytR/AlgR family response regulator|nr:response regulator [Flavobacteriales bacterium]MBK7941204.1 response regulator [Flavobacteriales bacterium]MBK8948720.1 response regulator [Flavobacteriales bacterium]MBK9701233.1 response regulator [Flavobacteriales bacterium]
MNHPRILVVEDEALIRKDIERSLTLLGYDVAGSTGDAAEAVDLAMEQRPDMVLMDIRLRSAMTGIEAAKVIRTNMGIPVVFLTAFSEDSTLHEAKLAEPLGYIVKPFTEAALRSNIEIALFKGGEESKLRMERDRLKRSVGKGQDDEHVFIKHRGRAMRVAFREIEHVEALKDYASFHLKDRRYVVHGTMQEFETMLPTRDFMRIHRSHIVRLDRIESIDDGDVVLEGGAKRIPIGRTYMSRLLALIPQV